MLDISDILKHQRKLGQKIMSKFIQELKLIYRLAFNI